MPIDSAARLASGIIHGLAVACCLGAFCFVGYRLLQILYLERVSALILRAGPSVRMVRIPSRKPYQRDSISQMYNAEALVQYEYQGHEYTVVARHDVSVSSKWFQERLTGQWEPGTRIRVRIDPSKPDQPPAGIALNWHTFTPALTLLAVGALLFGAGYGLRRLMDFMLPSTLL